ncbi:hypothetical protein Pgy4_34801, partial [Pseudomonas savastanoi pv. glycinea str. race 4]
AAQVCWNVSGDADPRGAFGRTSSLNLTSGETDGRAGEQSEKGAHEQCSCFLNCYGLLLMKQKIKTFDCGSTLQCDADVEHCVVQRQLSKTAFVR